MTDLIYHPKTRSALDMVISSTPQSILLIGQDGIGKASTATALAEQILDIKDFASYAYGFLVDPVNNEAGGIESIRQLQDFMSLKVLRKHDINRVAIIRNADKLSLQAQNALLKLIEEPPKNSMVILTAKTKTSVLPTIASRVQVIDISKPTKAELQSYFNDVAEADFNLLYSISNGLPGLLSYLIDSDGHYLRQATPIARQVLSSSSYDRLLVVDRVAKDKQLVDGLLTILQQMAEAALAQSPKNLARWQKVLELTYLSKQRLARNVQTKLVLTNLMLNL
jgi:DNA polymerase III delta prime subunit